MNETLKLITTTAEGTKLKKKEREVFCSRKSVRRSEFYAALAAGQNPRYELEVMTADYEMMKVRDQNSGKVYYPSEVEYQGENLKIIRAYQTPGDLTSLTCG